MEFEEMRRANHLQFSGARRDSGNHGSPSRAWDSYRKGGDPPGGQGKGVAPWAPALRPPTYHSYGGYAGSSADLMPLSQGEMDTLRKLVVPHKCPEHVAEERIENLTANTSVNQVRNTVWEFDDASRWSALMKLSRTSGVFIVLKEEHKAHEDVHGKNIKKRKDSRPNRPQFDFKTGVIDVSHFVDDTGQLPAAMAI